MKKRERLLALLEKGQVDGYVPAAFFMHFGADYQAGSAAVEKHKAFFRHTDMDFVKIQLELPFPSSPITSPEGWRQVPKLPLDFYGNQLEVVKGLVAALKSEALIVLTLYSPFMIAGNLGGRQALVDHMRQDPEPVAEGLNRVSESLLAFCRECIKAGVDGFYHSTQGGESGRLGHDGLFEKWVKPTDLAVMNEVNAACPFNILHVCDYHRDEFGEYEDIAPFLDYPGQVVNAPLDLGGSTKTSKELASLFGRPFMGGMYRKGPLASGSEDDAREAARSALADRPDQFILAADCTVPGDTPWDNLRAAIAEAHKS